MSIKEETTPTVMCFNGYVYTLSKDFTFEWDVSQEDKREIEMVSQYNDDKHAVHVLGARTIDGARCTVFLCRDRRVRAVVGYDANANAAPKESHA